MPESAVSSPTAVTRTRRLPPAATVPATTLSPAALATGTDSPVIIDSSTSAVPSTMTPSAGTRAPGRTSTTSSTASSASGTSSVPSSVTRSAVSGSSSARALSAPCAWAIERISIQWPSSMMTMSVESSHQISTSRRPERADPADDEGHHDGHRDERHHARLSRRPARRAHRAGTRRRRRGR